VHFPRDQTREGDMEKAFSEFGKIEECRIATDRNTGIPSSVFTFEKIHE
jgi:hypothetical protein